MMDALLRQYGIMSRLPQIAGAYKGKSVAVCGDAHCLWDDLEELGCDSPEDGGSVHKPGWDFMTVNMAGSKFPGVIEHWYSNAGYLVDRFRLVRREEYPPRFSVKHTHCCMGPPSAHPSSWLWPWVGHGTSGFGALLTALALGYDKIVLCGIPLNNQPHNGEPSWRNTNFVNEVRDDAKHWKFVAQTYRGRVSAMSGQPKEWFSAED
jgi:hypothetical protein